MICDKQNDEIQDSGTEQCYFDEMLSQHQKARKYQRFLFQCAFILYFVYFAAHAVYAFYGWIAPTYEQTHAKSISQCVDNVHKTIYSIVFFSFVFTLFCSKLCMHLINVCGFCLFSLSLNEIGFVWKIHTYICWLVCLFVCIQHKKLSFPFK